MQRKTNPIGPVEVPELSFTHERQESNDKAQNPDSHQNGDGTPAARCQVAEWVDDADVLLQGEIGEEQNRDLGGQHGQRAYHLAGQAIHPGLCVAVILAPELQVVCTNHKEVDTHQTVGTCPGKQREYGLAIISILFHNTLYIHNT